MHLKVFLKLENPKNSLLGKYIKKPKNQKKLKKNQENPHKTQINHWAGLKKKTGFFPTLAACTNFSYVEDGGEAAGRAGAGAGGPEGLQAGQEEGSPPPLQGGEASPAPGA
jgi:hypothetical protein